MSQFNENSMTDRLKAANEARQAALARFRDRPPADDPAVLARKAEREQIVRDREIRTRARDEARAAEEKVEQAAAARLEQKALRDARYAARKAKGRK